MELKYNRNKFKEITFRYPTRIISARRFMMAILGVNRSSISEFYVTPGN
jgi:hypothetical protein